MAWKSSSALDNLVVERLARLRRDTATKVAPGPLLEWIPKATAGYMEPRHLQPLLGLLERIIRGEQVRVVVHTPPRHAKTETLLHFIAWGLLHRPDWTFGYASYNAHIALSKSRVAMGLSLDAGVHLVSENAGEWRTTKRGGTLATGIGGTLTGFGLRVGIVDDPFKSRLEAESATYRERAKDWFRDVFLTRMEPGGSVIVNMARWHPDDLAGWLVREKGWDYLCLPCIDDEGRQLWPERWTLDELLELKRNLGEYSWASLYQGQPRPRGGSVFGDPVAWGDEQGMTALPKYWNAGIGIDLAFTARSSSDWSVIVVMKHAEGRAFVVDVLRVQTRAPEFKQLVRRYREQYPTARIRWYASGTEKGSADFFSGVDYLPNGGRLEGVPVEVMRPNGDKFTRAIPYAASWNAKKVLVPGDSHAYPWMNKFVEEHVNFTGVNDATDDQVDAGCAAHDVVMGAPAGYRSVKEAGGNPGSRRL